MRGGWTTVGSVCVLWGLALTSVPSARAETPVTRATEPQTPTPIHLRFEYRGPEGACPREDEAFLTLRTNLPQVPDDTLRASQIEVLVAHEGQRFSGRVTVQTDGRARAFSRELESASCPDLLRALSFVLGVAYRESARAPDPRDAIDVSNATATPAPPAPLARPERPAPAPAPQTPSRWELAVGARGGALWGVAPTAAPRAEGYVEIGLARRSVFAPVLRVGPSYATQSTDVSGTGGHAEFSVLAGQATACPLRIGGERGKVALLPCARLELGQLLGAGVGIPAARDARTLWAATGVELDARYRVSDGFGFDLVTSLLFPLRREIYLIEPDRVVQETNGAIFSVAGGAFFSAL